MIVGWPDFDPILRSAWSYHGERSYGRNSYERPATVIQQIRRLVGEEKFWRAFRAYAERWRWDRPTTEDFLDAMRATGIPRLRRLRPEDLLRHRLRRLPAPPRDERVPRSVRRVRRRRKGDEPSEEGLRKEERRRLVRDRRRRRPGRGPRPPGRHPADVRKRRDLVDDVGRGGEVDPAPDRLRLEAGESGRRPGPEGDPRPEPLEQRPRHRKAPDALGRREGPRLRLPPRRDPSLEPLELRLKRSRPIAAGLSAAFRNDALGRRGRSALTRFHLVEILLSSL